MMNAHEDSSDKADVEDDKIGGMKWDETTTKGYKGKQNLNQIYYRFCLIGNLIWIITARLVVHIVQVPCHFAMLNSHCGSYIISL